MYTKIYDYGRVIAVGSDFNRKHANHNKNPKKKFGEILEEKTGSEQTESEQKGKIDTTF